CLPPKKVPLVVAATVLTAAVKPSPAPTQVASAAPAASPSIAASPSPTTTETPAASPSATVAIGAPSGGNATPPVSNANDADLTRDLKKRGLFSYLWFALGAGLLALLTPCVFPMIPITVSVFSKREHDSHTLAIRDAVIFCLGIILTYTVLGMALAFIAG